MQTPWGSPEMSARTQTQFNPPSSCPCLCPFVLCADSPGQPCPDSNQDSASRRQEAVVALNPADCHHAVPRAQSLAVPQTQRQLCALSRALCAAPGTDPSRGHEVGTSHPSVALLIPSGVTSRTEAQHSLTRELFADHIPPVPSQLGCPWRC